jgi:peptidoglycan/xylan/chitin deacetylase (PgdA/CDA1 family)
MSGPRAVSVAAVKATSALADRVRRPARGVVILLYHRVGGRSSMSVDLPAALFDEQMAWLAARGAATHLGDALHPLETPDAPAVAGGDEPDPVVVSFDDGTSDLVEVALPILVRHRVPAVFYVATDFIERSRPFPDDGVPLSWSAVAEAVSTGLVTIGSHTDTHALLDRIEPAVASGELDRSRRLVEDRVGVPALDFAYPKAVAGTAAVDAIVRDRFRSAALGGCRPNPYGRTDVHRLARSAIQRSDGMRYFEHKALGGMALEDRLRRTVNRRRYAGAVT